MPFIPTNVPVLKFVVEGTSNDVNIDNLVYFSYGGGPPSSADCVQFANLLAGEWKTNFQPLLSPSYQFHQVVCTDITTDTGAQGVSTIAAWFGTDTGAEFPNSVCGVISWSINRRYRGGKPRWYIGPLTQASSNDSRTMTDVYAKALGLAGEQIGGTLDGATSGTTSLAAIGTVSRVANKVPRNPLVFEVFNPIFPTVDTRYGSQRRRLGKLTADRQVD